MSSQVTSPQEFFGFQMGADRKLARWDRIVEYFYTLQSESDRIQVIDVGPSTEGNPFLLVIISSPSNLANLERLKEVNQKITDPRGLAEEEIRQLIKEGKVVILQSMSLHATEIGGTQMAPELAYDLLSRNDEETARILDNVVFLMVPCFNPDGQIMVTDWYNRWLGTKYEGCSLPWLYHKYAGHDNNRDAFAQNLVESQYMGRIMLREWRPQAYQDHHHMGSYGARLYVAPYSNPVRPDVDPLVWRELEWYGAHMAYRLEQEGKQGILNGAQFPGWGHYGFHWITNSHNIVGMLTESASAKLATPLYIHASQLTGVGDKTMPEYSQQTNFPNPWQGGWWRLRDIVEQQKIAAWALLDAAAKNREMVLWNSYLKAKRQTERGEKGHIRAYVISPKQHDPLTARKLIQILLNQGVEVQVAEEPFDVDGVTYPTGTFVVPLAQPKRGVITQLLGQYVYPDNWWTKTPDGSPRVFDAATDCVAEYMGVKVQPVEDDFDGEMRVVNALPRAYGQIVPGEHGYVWDGRLNDSYIAANRLMRDGVAVYRLDEDIEVGERVFPRGAFYCKNIARDKIEQLANDLGIDMYGLESEYKGSAHEIKPLRIGIYQRYYGGNADEGWTRFLLEKFEFVYQTIRDGDITAGKLNEIIDVLILPSDWKQMVLGLADANTNDPTVKRFKRWFGDTVPKEYQSGIGREGAKAIREFVQAGGRLVAMNRSCDMAIEFCELKVRNVVAKLKSKEYCTHGSTLRAIVHNDDVLAYGMPGEALLFSWDSPVFQVDDYFRAENYRVIAEYPAANVLQSGLLVGEERIAGKAAVLAAKCGSGEVILLGTPPQFRAQTHGTYKLLFNCLQ